MNLLLWFNIHAGFGLTFSRIGTGKNAGTKAQQLDLKIGFSQKKKKKKV